MASRAEPTAPRPRPYTANDVVQQSLVSFGQATSYMRVNRDAAQYVVDLMRETIERFRVHETWETDAVQVLERLRAIGRLAALYATQDGRTVVDGEDVSRASSRVRISSKTLFCPNMEGESAAFPSSL